MTNNEKLPYAYLLGASHSGTTLLALSLNAHKDVATIGESAPGGMGCANTYRCSCRELIQQCPFWRRLAGEIAHASPEFDVGNFGTAFNMSPNPVIRRVLRMEHRGVFLESCRDLVLRLSPSWRWQFARSAANCVALASAVLRLKQARVFVDSSKIAHRLKFLLQVPALDIKVIHIVRDGRAVSLTYMNQAGFADAADPRLRSGGRGLPPGSPPAGLKMDRAADEWRRCIRSAQLLLRQLPKQKWMQVRYEDFCATPRATLDRIFAFLGLDPGRTASDFRSVEHHILGNGMRLDMTSQICLDERWRSVLTEDDLRVFDSIAGDLNHRYGYL